MAPCRLHASATALSSEVRAHDGKTILVEAGGFQPVCWFLDRESRLTVDSIEPPLKRRRTTKAEPTDAESQPSLAKPEVIPLFEVTIDFHFPETLNSRTPKESDLLDDVDFSDSEIVPVAIDEAEHVQGDTRLLIVLQRRRSPILSVECSAVPENILTLLKDIGIVGRLANPTNRYSHPAAVLSCTLACSKGLLFNVIRLTTCLSWKSGISAFSTGASVSRSAASAAYNSLLRAFPISAADEASHSKNWTPQDFYESVHVPPIDEDVNHISSSLIQSDLFPFQKRTVAWMLRREGVEMKEGHIVHLSTEAKQRQAFSLYETRRDLNGQTCSVNTIQGIVNRNPKADPSVYVSGGLLAEEMGLGKTVELLALIALHQRHTLYEVQKQQDSATSLLSSHATLIITPPVILHQWKSEIRRHAPDLRVYHYEGMSSGHKMSASADQALLSRLASNYDVVLTTYQVLAKEVHFAEEPPERNMRHRRKFERKRSLLVQIQWWRICLDEAQMVESGVTAAARVACCLPRVNSWAVTGTPLRKNVEDLHGLLIFLRYSPFDQNAKLWIHLVRRHKDICRRIFGQIALRHTKAQVREELRLPPQRRIVVTFPFSMVEQQNYDTLFDAMCEDVGVNGDGSPRNTSWDPHDRLTIEAMRTWLVRLRQTCLHPELGGRNRRALGRRRGPLRTVAEVLEVMIEQNEVSLRAEERAVLISSLLRGHILGNDGENDHRSETALGIYQSAMQASDEMLKDARARLSAAKISEVEDGDTDNATSNEDSSPDSNPLVGRLRSNVRTALELHHICIFFTATAYYQIKTNESLTKPDSDEFKMLETHETELYESAKLLRTEILKVQSRKAETWMRKIAALQQDKTFTKFPAVKDLDHLGGIESRRIIETSHRLFDVIRKQVNLITGWRSRMADLLLKPLVDKDEGIETTGDEYEDSTKQQDELYVYFDALKVLYADLNYFVTGEAAPLIDHEAKMALRDAKWALDPEFQDEHRPNVHAPELAIKLLSQRNELRSRMDMPGSIHGLLAEARGIEGSMQWNDPTSRAATERKIVQSYHAQLQSVFGSYTKALKGLEEEIDIFRAAQNQRVEFYRSLQELSDAVAPYKEELDPKLDVKALDLVTRKEAQQSKSLAQLKTKHRFLEHLRDEAGAQAGPRICVICQSAFENGVLTVCGHQYCKECIQHWFKQSKTCPVCKKKLRDVDIHDITYKPQDIRAREEAQSGPSSSPTAASNPADQTSVYSAVDSNILDEIKAIDLPTSYSTKIDTLGRHLLWLRKNDPGAKSIIFSQYREFLNFLSDALAAFRIRSCQVGQPGATEKFGEDPSIDCLLLDAKTDSSGLTVVSATHVFICEPLLQTAVELQAIARVHRIGQMRATTVWMYQISDTVEEAVYELSVARRLAHVQLRNSNATRNLASRPANRPALQETVIDAANSEELQSAPLTKLLVAAKGGGEIVRDDDLWQCLFGATRKAVSKAGNATKRNVDRHLLAEAAEQRAGNLD